jgi:hypothetical protein
MAIETRLNLRVAGVAVWKIPGKTTGKLICRLFPSGVHLLADDE